MIKAIARFLDLKRSRAFCCAPRALSVLLVWITSECNLDCRMCGEGYRRKKSEDRKVLTRDDWVSVIHSAKLLKTMVVSVTGGEPLLNPDLTFILNEINEAGLSAHLCTNGTLLTQQHIADFESTNLKSISISLDSHNAATHNYIRNSDCFDQTISAIQLLKQSLSGMKINLNYMLCRKNFRDMKDVVRLAKDMGVDQVSFAPIHDNMQHKYRTGDGMSDLLFLENDISDLEEEIRLMRSVAHRLKMRVSSGAFLDGIPRYCRGVARWRDCYAGYVSCSVSPWGDVSPCSDIDSNQNVRDRSLYEIWRSEDFKKLRRKVDGCNSPCWDTSNAEMSIRCSCVNILQNIPAMFRDYMLYAGRGDE